MGGDGEGRCVREREAGTGRRMRAVVWMQVFSSFFFPPLRVTLTDTECHDHLCDHSYIPVRGSVFARRLVGRSLLGLEGISASVTGMDAEEWEVRSCSRLNMSHPRDI